MQVVPHSPPKQLQLDICRPSFRFRTEALGETKALLPEQRREMDCGFPVLCPVPYPQYAHDDCTLSGFFSRLAQLSGAVPDGSPNIRDSFLTEDRHQKGRVDAAATLAAYRLKRIEDPGHGIRIPLALSEQCPSDLGPFLPWRVGGNLPGEGERGG
jgi:hypothetical protein